MAQRNRKNREPASAACVNCSYDLAGLDLSAKCPECGFPVERSLREKLLRNEPAEWLDRCVRGVRLWHRGGWMGVLIVLVIPIVLIGALGFELLGVSFDHPAWDTAGAVGAWVLVTGLVAAGVMYVRGLWLVTSPKADGESLLGRVRTPARWSAIALPFALAVNLTVSESTLSVQWILAVMLTTDVVIIAHLWTSARVAKRLCGYVESLPDKVKKRIRYAGRDAVLVAVITVIVVPWRYGQFDPIALLAFLFIVSYVGVLGEVRKLMEMEQTIAVEKVAERLAV